MKKIGLVGGTSWTSTIDYYRFFNEEVNKKLGDLNFAECIIYSVNFDHFHRCNAAHDWESSFHLLTDAAIRLVSAGADVILLGANTAHIVADKVRTQVPVPLIDIRDVTAKAIKARNLQRVGLLGTKYTMELDFYKDRLAAKGIESIIPMAKDQRDFIEQTLLYELGKGIIKTSTKQGYLKIVEELIKEGAQGIILGCTEIPLLIGQEDINIPVFNTTHLHAKAAVDHVLDGISINQ